MKTLQENGYRSAPGIQELAQHSEMLYEGSLDYHQLSKGKFRGDLQELHLDGVQIFKERISESVFQHGENDTDSLCFGVFDYLSDDARWMGESVEVDDVTWAPSCTELMLKTPKLSSLYGISIPNKLISDLVDESLLTNMSSLKHPELSIQIRQRIDYMLNGLMQHPMSVTNNQARHQFHTDVRTLVASFADLLTDGKQDQRHINRAQFIIKARKIVSMIHEAILENHAEPLTIDDLCKMSFTSRRGLHNCFIAVTGQSPAAFLKIMRLNAVKRQLANGIGGNVSDIAMDWGFWHLSQFTQDYKKLFGELPSQTHKFYQ